MKELLVFDVLLTTKVPPVPLSRPIDEKATLPLVVSRYPLNITWASIEILPEMTVQDDGKNSGPSPGLFEKTKDPALILPAVEKSSAWIFASPTTFKVAFVEFEKEASAFSKRSQLIIPLLTIELPPFIRIFAEVPVLTFIVAFTRFVMVLPGVP